MLTAASSAMIYGLLPVFMIKELGFSMASVGLIEGAAEAANSFIKVLSGTLSDRLGRRKPLVVLGYMMSTAVKALFPVAESAGVVLIARVLDRLGKGVRDAPRDALLADVTSPIMRGKGFGLRLGVAVAGFVIGPVLAMGLMRFSGSDFRLVFWLALIPACLSIILLIVAVKEVPLGPARDMPRYPIRSRNLAALPAAFWWTIAVAGALALARLSHAFLLLKAYEVGVDAAFVPMVLVVMYLVYSATAYPFGIAADHIDRHLQLGTGALVLVGANLLLAVASDVPLIVLGAALWGLHLGVTQGALGAIIADTAPDHLRGAAFGIYDVSVGSAAFVAGAGAGVLWMASGPQAAFLLGACISGAAGLVLLLRAARRPPGAS